MNLEQMKLDIEERERIISEMDIKNPLYHIVYNTLLERKEKYDIMIRNATPKREYRESRE